MAKKIKVIIKDPSKKPRSVWISNSLENLQKTVGGHIKTVTIAEDMVIICNKEGRIKNPPYNCDVCGVSFCGTIIFAGVDGEEFGSIPIDFKRAKELFSSALK